MFLFTAIVLNHWLWTSKKVGNHFADSKNYWIWAGQKT